MPLPYSHSPGPSPVPSGADSPTLWTPPASYSQSSKTATLPSTRYPSTPSPSSNTRKVGPPISPMLRASYTHEYLESTRPVQQESGYRKRAESVDTYARVKH